MPDHEEIPMESVLLGWARDAGGDSQRFTGDGIYERAGPWSMNCGAGSSPGHDGRASADTAARRHRPMARQPTRSRAVTTAGTRRPDGHTARHEAEEQRPGRRKKSYAI